MTTKLLNNRYQVIQVLSAGGFGETFLAEDTHMPSRRCCVIKQLKPVTNDPQTYHMIQKRFEREAATLEYLGESSDQIPKLYAYFSENGQFYLVQEWIQGQTLAEIIKAKGSLSETTVREIVLSLLSVLDYVHSKGIIHRDIKPDNIILRSSNGKPILIDFGALKETIVSVVNSPGYPIQSLVIGTPGYMSSEQAIGRPVYATDIYSLGLTAIYLLSGKHPYELQTNPQTGELLWHHHASGMSSNLAMVLNQAIKPQASDRYSTASKMLHALQSAYSISHTPTSTTQPTVALTNAAAASQPTQLFSSPQNTRVTPASSNTPRNWQKPTWIVGSLVVGGLIGAVAITSITRQPAYEVPIVTSSTTPTPLSDDATNPDSSPESPTPTDESSDSPVSSPPSPVSVTPISPRKQQPVTLAPAPAPVASAPQQPQEEELTSDSIDVGEASPPREALESRRASPSPDPQTEDFQPPVASKPQPQPVTPAPEPAPVASTPEPEEENETDDATDNTTSRGVPGFPTGTSESAIRAALGNPNKVSRGLWKTRAYLYQLEPNRIDVGYLFDRKSGALRQTEVGFAQSVQPEVMQATLQGMLGGNANSEIEQGLQRVYQRQTNEYSFNVGGLKGVIQRNREDQIYIGVWDADLH